MYQSAQKTTRCQRAHKGLGTQNTPNATAFCSSRSPMPFLNPNPLSQKTANSAGFKTGRNAAITQSKRNATFLFEAQFAFSNSVPHFFSLPHMMFILCCWRFLRFWTQNTPNPTRFCSFAPFSWLERLHRAENSPFSTQKEKYISKPDLNIFCLFFARCTFSNMCPRRCSAGVKSWKQAQSLLTSRSYICYSMRDRVHKEQL